MDCGRFFQNNGHVLQFVKRNFQIVALLNLPRPFKKEYGIDVDAAFLVGYKVYEHTDKEPVPHTGEWTGGQNPPGLAAAAVCDETGREVIHEPLNSKT